MHNGDPLRLDTLPPELLLKVLAHLPPRAVALLGRTNRLLHEMSQTDSIWKAVVMGVHRLDPTFVMPEEDVVRRGGSWADQARFVLPRAKHLGFWASSQPYASRILRVRTSYSAQTPRPDHSSLQIIAEQLVPSNLLDSPDYRPDPPLSLPNAAVAEGLNPNSGYQLPRSGPGSHSPDAGLHVELLHETFSWAPVFVISPERGARLPNDQAVGPGSVRLRLERTMVKVGSLAELERESDDDEEGERRSRTAAMLSLFAGRPPKRAWPTVHLYGGEAIVPPGGVPANPSQIRFKGAMRGLFDSLDGTHQPVVKHTAIPAPPPPEPSWPGASFSQWGKFKSSCEGFHIVAVRAVSSSTPATPSMPRTSSGFGTPSRVESPAVERRLGVGRDGGPAILWHGQERDPEQGRRRVTIVRAGGGNDGVGGLILRMENQLDHRRETPVEDEDDLLEEVVRTERENLFPIVAPATKLAFDDPPSTDAHGDILASSVEGLWVGTYGHAHGLEMGHITVKLARENQTLPNGERRQVLSRTLSFVKVTGDQNIPSGQISWTAMLDPLEIPPNAPLTDEGFVPDEALDLGTVPSVTSEELVRWTNLDPTQQGAEQPRWDAGSVPGVGQIALVGFVHRSWTGAVVTFIRSKETLYKKSNRYGVDGELGASERREVEVVDEIRVRWKELGCVSVFKRVRI